MSSNRHKEMTMDGKQFDAIAQSLAFAHDRRGIVRLLAGSALGGLVLAGTSDVDARRKKKKVTLCLNGQTLKVKKNKKNGLLDQGATLGGCPSPPPPPSNTCTDGIQNGTETDIDCGGGSCPRCGVGKKCNTRNDCVTALCVGGVCKSCDNAADCGIDTGGNDCACRTSRNLSGVKFCSNVNGGTINPGNSCNLCNANQGCSESDGGANSECAILCGAS